MLKKYFKALPLVSAVCLASCCQPQQPPHMCVMPLPAGFVPDSIVDDTLAASFSAKDFNWSDRSLTFTSYGETRYDTALVNRLRKGDTIVYENKKMVIDTLVCKEGFIEINGGVEEGGMWLSDKAGGAWPGLRASGSYRATEMDDHSVYFPVGRMTIPLSDRFAISDCGDNPGDKQRIVDHGQKAYLYSLPDYKRDFSCLSTRVIIKDGKVETVIRHWIP